MKSRHIVRVGAGRYHTAMCTEKELYTVGKNLGQLGYEKSCETQVVPRTVSCGHRQYVGGRWEGLNSAIE